MLLGQRRKMFGAQIGSNGSKPEVFLPFANILAEVGTGTGANVELSCFESDSVGKTPTVIGYCGLVISITCMPE